MRLPSHNQDTKDILRNMSIASDTPEDFRIIEADDYLQPRATMLEPPPQTPPHHVNMNGKLEGVHFQSLISIFKKGFLEYKIHCFMCFILSTPERIFTL